ncbi:hypothetical protein ACFSJU_17330 [Paradesertivirga mongoliensis]|uniref:PH domain-containing protein n=1 Tax=Paradesertivirga mongoliensis TaxID=2100740 RepID=A0ABW4ZPZ0_9SPHI|nr:hypothetical protein [Pedobacter mongoliensis]
MSKTKQKAPKKDLRPVMTAKKHWIVYILPAAVVIAGLALVTGEHPIFKAAGAGLSLFGLVLILKRATEKWHLTDQHLIIEEGIMPWAKNYHEVSVHDIYKTQTDANPRLKKLFNVGTVKARRRADNCLGFKHSFVANPEEFSDKLQTIVQKLPSNNLNTLYELKEKGAISETQYNVMKLGHITHQHLS